MKKRYMFTIAIIIIAIMVILFLVNVEFLKIYLALLIVLALLLIVPFFIVDIQAKPPIRTIIQYNVKEEKFKNRKVFVITSKENKKSDKYILYLHGGAYVMEATYKHWQFLEEIVDRTGMTLILPDYPLTPKNTYKEVFDMIEPLYKETIKKLEMKI